MAQTKKKRRRKHRGTQGGGIDRRGRRGRPRTREEARAQAKRRSEYRRSSTAPTWRSATIRGLIGAVVFFGLTIVIFGKTAGEAALLSVIMLALYIPLGFYVDQFFYKRRRRQELAARAAEKQAAQKPTKKNP